MAQRSDTLLLSPAVPSPPLGLGSLNAEDYVVDTFPFGREATLLLYTDGAIEARNDDGQFYDLGAHVADWPGSRPEELLQHVLDGLSLHVGGGAIKLDDDIAMIAVQYRDGFPSPSPHRPTSGSSPPDTVAAADPPPWGNARVRGLVGWERVRWEVRADGGWR